jgi:hypothetical protein
VGPDRRNDPRDVIKVQTLLGNRDLGSFGRFQGPLGILQEEDVEGIKAWQSRNRLKVDGYLNPAGETIRSMRKSMGNLLGAFKAPTPDEVDEHHAGTRGLGEEKLVRRQPFLRIGGEAKDLPEVPGEDTIHIAKAVDTLGRYRDAGEHPRFTAMDIGAEGAVALARTRDMLRRLGEKSPDLADAYLRKLFTFPLPQGTREALTGEPEPERIPVGVLKEEWEKRRTPDFVERRPCTPHPPGSLSIMPDGCREEPHSLHGADIGAGTGAGDGAGGEPEGSEASGDAGNLPNFETGAGGERPKEGEVPPYSDEELYRRQKALTLGSKVGRAIGLDVAADNLDAFLGDGKKPDFGPERLRELKPVADMEEKNRKRIGDEGFLGEMTAGGRKLADLRDGESLDFTGMAETHNGDKASGPKRSTLERFGESPNFALAFGRANFNSKVEVKATREGDTIHINGMVEHTLRDNYKFDHEDRGASLARPLQESGRAQGYDNSHGWRQPVEGSIPILADGTFGRPTLHWGKVTR